MSIRSGQGRSSCLSRYVALTRPVLFLCATKLCNNLSGFFHFPNPQNEGDYHDQNHDDRE